MKSLALNNKKLNLLLTAFFNINGEREDFIEALKLDTQYTKDAITLVPRILHLILSTNYWKR
jgi:hypothetical protein